MFPLNARTLFQEDLAFAYHVGLLTLRQDLVEVSTAFLGVFDLLYARLAAGAERWAGLLQAFLLIAVDLDSLDLLHQLLALGITGSGQRKPVILAGESMPVNSQALIRACEGNKYWMVKAFIKRGFRLKTGHWTQRTLDELDSWQRYCLPARFLPGLFIAVLSRRYTEIPFLSRRMASFENSRDEIAELTVLKAMASPSYIVGCYMVVQDARNLAEAKDDMFQGCECHQHHKSQKANKGLKSLMAYEVSQETFHFCPAHPRFVPNMDCRRHLECSDPIYKCFYFANLATKCAKASPEFFTEYMDIAQSCHDTSVDLLNVCLNTAEVTLLLSEHAGARSYFR